MKYEFKNELTKQLEQAYNKVYSVKTKAAINKQRDRLIDIESNISDILKTKYTEYLPKGYFTVYGIISGVGGIESTGSNIKILDVYLREIVVSVPTKEYPNGEVFKVPFSENKFGMLNLDRLLST